MFGVCQSVYMYDCVYGDGLRNSAYTTASSWFMDTNFVLFIFNLPLTSP